MDKSSIFFIEKRNDEYIDISQFPKELFVDASFIIKMYGKDYKLEKENNPKELSKNTQQKNCRTFHTDCVVKNVELFVTNDIYFEVEHVVQRNVTKAIYESLYNTTEYPPKGMGEKQVYDMLCSEHKGFVQKIEDEINSIHKLMSQTMMTLDYKNDSNFLENVQRIRKELKYSVNVSDVEHALVAHMYGINSVATTDADFNRFDNFNIYTLSTDKMKKDRIGRANVFLPFDDNKI